MTPTELYIVAIAGFAFAAGEALGYCAGVRSGYLQGRDHRARDTGRENLSEIRDTINRMDQVNA